MFFSYSNGELVPAVGNQENFLVSFLVDARGGLLESKRYPGLRFIIPPNASIGPLRIICRLLRYPSYSITPPLNDGEGLACRLIEVGPMGVHFNAPILIEVPYCASVRTNQREIVVLRSENGEVWKEHPVDPSDHAVQDSLGQYFADAIPSNELRKRRVHRILTTSFPQYFALVTRPKQDLILVGPEGSNLTSSLDPGVQVSFPRGALQKRIRVGLQVQNVDQCLVAACLGSPRITVSPIVTIEPRRRKFHRPISVFIPLPASTGASASEAEEEHRTNEKGGKDKHKNARDLSTLRLLCSITGGTQPAIWEDITGSSPFKLHKDCVSFTTTVSARLWLIDCPSLSEVSEMAARVYREASAVPYLGRFVVYARRHHPEEAQVRALCLTDDSEQKTLECQEGFEVVARTEDLVEFLHNRPVWLETAGNVVPVAPAASSASMASAEGGSTDDHQPRFASVRAFEENRMNVVLRIKDVNAPPAGQLAFMPRQRQPGGDSVEPLSVLDIVLPRMADSMMVGGTPSVQRQSTMQGSGMATTVENFFNGSARQESSEDECRSVGHRYGKCRLIESIARSDLDIKKVASGLDADWVRLAPHLGLSQSDIDQIRGDGLDSEYKKALTCLTMWQEKSGPAATGTALAHALKRLGREDVLRQSMQNVSLVQSGPELSHALQSLDATDSPRQRRVVGDRSTEADDAVMKGPHSTEAEGYEEEDVVTAITRNVDDGVLEATIVPPAAMAQPRGQSQASAVYEAEKKSALEELAQSLIEEDSRVPTVPPVRQDSGEGVHEEELVPATVPHGIVVQSAVPAFVNEEIERQEWNSSLESPRESSTVIIAAGGPGPTSSSDVDDTTSATEAGDVGIRSPKAVPVEEREDVEEPSRSPVTAVELRGEGDEEEVPPIPPVRVDSRQRGAAAFNKNSVSCTHLSITHETLDQAPSTSCYQLPSHVTEVQVSPAASIETYRADFVTEEGSTLPPMEGDDPVISGEFVLVRQTIDDSNTPRVKQDTQMMVPVPLHAAASLGSGPLIGPGVCRVTTETRQQAVLDGHFRLRRKPAKPSRRRLPEVEGKQGEVEEGEDVPPIPPQRTTSLTSNVESLSGSTSTLASVGEAHGVLLTQPPKPFR